MATLDTYIRTQNKAKQTVKVRFRLRDKSIVLNYTSEIEIPPKSWDTKKQNIKKTSLMDDLEKIKLEKLIHDRKNLILSIYHNSNRHEVDSFWLQSEVEKALNPPTQKAIKKVPAKKKVQTDKSLICVIDEFLKKSDMSDLRKETYMVAQRSLERFQYYKSFSQKYFSLDLDDITENTLAEIETFFIKEPDLNQLNPNIQSVFKNYKQPTQRAQNTVNGFLRMIRATFNWSIKHEKTTNYPFRKYKIKECVYGTPFFPTQDEILQVYNLALDEHSTLANQRDIFIFQCMIGCRIHDLYLMTKNCIIDGCIEYIPSKTNRKRADTISVPLNQIALDILKKYDKSEKFLPFISEQKYNAAIKEIFTLAGITRNITIMDPKTRKEVAKPLNVVISSHASRRYFIGNLFNNVQDPSLISSMSGHVNGSKAFERYRTVNKTIKQNLVDLLCK